MSENDERCCKRRRNFEAFPPLSTGGESFDYYNHSSDSDTAVQISHASLLYKKVPSGSSLHDVAEHASVPVETSSSSDNSALTAEQQPRPSFKTVRSLFRSASNVLSRLAAKPTIATSLQGMYGENRLSSICRLLDLLRRSFGMGPHSVFLDIGSGRGVPNLAAAFLFGVRASIGLEIDYPVWQLSRATYASALESAVPELLPEVAQLTLPRSIALDGGGSSLGVAFGMCDASELLSLEPATHIFSFDLAMPPWVVRRFVVLFNACGTAEVLVTFRRDLLDLGVRAVPVAQTVMNMAGSGEQHRVTVLVKPEFLWRKAERQTKRQRHQPPQDAPQRASLPAALETSSPTGGFSPSAASVYKERQETTQSKIARLSLKELKHQADCCDAGICYRCSQQIRMPFAEMRDAWRLITERAAPAEVGDAATVGEPTHYSHDQAAPNNHSDLHSAWCSVTRVEQARELFYNPPFLFLTKNLAEDNSIASFVYEQLGLTVAEAVGTAPDASVMAELGVALRTRASQIEQLCCDAAARNPPSSSDWDCFLDLVNDPSTEQKRRLLTRSLFYQAQLPLLVQLEYLSTELATWWTSSTACNAHTDHRPTRRTPEKNSQTGERSRRDETEAWQFAELQAKWRRFRVQCRCTPDPLPCIPPGGKIVFY